jgi:uncharacterized alkaline shock family protein YloU
MALSPRDTTELPCGRALAPLVEQVAERTPPADPEHQAGCPYCGAALAELEALWSDVGELARERVEVPPGLVAAVMRRIRRERDGEDPPARATGRRGPRPGRPGDHAVLRSPRGATRVADEVVAALAGRAALAVVGVSLPGRSPVEAHFDGAAVALALELTVALGPPLPALIRAVRVGVIAEVEALTGLTVTAVNVAVVDLADD